ncbi:unnamed protein product [Tuber aestivum]|uniref:Uncharacterized protein n=1 Tax=Tuber aestivum TaxID=59557 RepID=A0A292PMH0_9PEZI|nr:unnamed protein product [Tuber aestivum]
MSPDLGLAMSSWHPGAATYTNEGIFALAFHTVLYCTSTRVPVKPVEWLVTPTPLPNRTRDYLATKSRVPSPLSGKVKALSTSTGIPLRVSAKTVTLSSHRAYTKLHRGELSVPRF